MKCPKCGLTVEQNAPACPACGQPLACRVQKGPAFTKARQSFGADASAHAAPAHAKPAHAAPVPPSAVPDIAPAEAGQPTQLMDAAEAAGMAATGQPTQMMDADVAARLASTGQATQMMDPSQATALMDDMPATAAAGMRPAIPPIDAPATEALFAEKETGAGDQGLDRIGPDDVSGPAATRLMPVGGHAAIPTAAGQPASGDPEKKPQRARWAILAAVAALVLAAGIAFLGYQRQWWGGVAIPDVVGQTADEATATLGKAGLQAKIDYVFVDKDAGTVQSMGNAAGTRVPRGTVVELVVGKARTVPDIVGMTKEKAAEALKEAGAASVHYAYKNSDKPEDTVIACDPPAATAFAEKDTINVTLSQSYVVPDLVGMKKDAAEAALKEHGLKADFMYKESKRPKDTVDSTNPSAGTKIAAGSSVVVFLSKGAGQTDACHLAAYFSETPEDIAEFLTKAGYTLSAGSITKDNEAACVYQKDDSPVISFTPNPCSPVQLADGKTDALADGATVAGVQLLMEASAAGVKKIDQAGIAAVAGLCGFSGPEAVTKNGPSTAIAGAGTDGSLVWTAIIWEAVPGAPLKAVVMCTTSDYYAAQNLTDMGEIAAFAMTGYLGGR